MARHVGLTRQVVSQVFFEMVSPKGGGGIVDLAWLVRHALAY